MKSIGIVILATNAYFILGIRFMKRFVHFYKGDCKITFYFFSDTNPKDYIPDSIDVRYFHTTNNSWVDGTNLKFKCILSIQKQIDSDYLFYFDADTNVEKEFTEEWFLGELVGGEHYDNNFRLKDNKPFDRNPKSKAYVPENTNLKQMYYYGAFFGGMKYRMFEFCALMYLNQLEDKKIPYEPAVNDESYINQYFHFNPPTKIVPCTEFKFLVSDKGGIGNTREYLDISEKKKQLLKLKNKLFNIQNNIIYEEV
jgi:hypothetical protein